MDETNLIICESCGESPATIHLAEASFCDECGERDLQEELTPIFGFKPCCTIIWHNANPAICVARAGTEHDHA